MNPVASAPPSDSLSSARAQRSNSSEVEALNKKKFEIRDLLCALAVFAFALAVCLWQNPSNVLPRTTLYFDGGHYLDSCHQIYVALGELLRGTATKATAESVAYYLFLDGPVLPLTACAALILQGKAPVASEWCSLVQMQCVLQATVAAGIYYLTKKLTGRKMPAIAAGVVWALYPATLASCGLFLTEPLACCLLVGSMVVLHQSMVEESTFTLSSISKRILAGILCCALVLLKPALIPAVAVLCGLSIFCSEKRLRAMAAFSTVVIGASITLAPWLWFTHYATGKYVVLPSRRPVYNIATGLNIESDGWGYYPTHPVTLRYSEDQSAARVATELFTSEPIAVSNMILRKATRFWSYPWNDFRYKIAGLNIKAQAFFQWTIVTLTLAAFVLFGALAAAWKNRLSRSELFIATASMSVIACHLFYLPFEGIARYGFTAMPLAVLLAVTFVTKLAGAKPSWKWLMASIAGLVVAGILLRMDLLPLVCVFGVDAGLSLEFILKSACVLFLSVAACKLALQCIRVSYPSLSIMGSDDVNQTEREPQPKPEAVDLLKGEPANFAERSIWERNKRATARSQFVACLLSTSICAASLLILFAFTTSSRDARQWQAQLRPGMSATRHVFIDRLAANKPSWALVLVDKGADGADAKIGVNGKTVEGHLESIYQFYGSKYELQNYISMFASLVRQPPERLRQWRAVEIDPTLLKFGQFNDISIAPGSSGKVTVYGDYQTDRTDKGELYLSSFEGISPGKLFHGDDDDLDCRVLQRTYSAKAPATCSLVRGGQSKTDDLSTKPGKQTGQYRLFVVMGYANKADTNALNTPQPLVGEPPAAPPVNQFNIDVPFDYFDDPAKNAVSKVLSAGGPHRAKVSIPSEMLSSGHVDVTIEGDVHPVSRSATRMGVAAVLQTGGQQDLATVLPGSPIAVDVNPNGKTSFVLQGSVPSSTLRGTSPTIIVELSPADKVSCDKLTLAVRKVKRANFDGHTAKFF